MLFVMVKLGIAALPALGILGLAWEVLDRYMPLPNHVIRPLQQRRRDRQAEGLRGLEIDHEIKLGRRFAARLRRQSRSR